MAERRASRPVLVFATDAERQAEALRRKRGRNRILLLVLLGGSAMLYALTLVKLMG